MPRYAAMNHQMRRRVFFTVGFVCAGLLTTLAIAWAAVRLKPLGRHESLLVFVHPDGLGTMGHGDIGIGWAVVTSFGEEVSRPSATSVMVFPEPPYWTSKPQRHPAREFAAVDVGAGWPMISFVATCEGVAHHEPPPGGAWHTGLGPQWVEWISWHGALGNPDPLATPGPAQQKILPIGIRPAALLVNVAAWTFAWWLPMATLTTFRRRRRVKRGRCPSCGYDLRGKLGLGCSECGWNRAGPRVLARP